jgi:DNA uptake protein ComE-like DNA-binding protein
MEDYSRLPGVGPKLAQQIVAYGAQQGPLRRVEDLMIFKGIGSKKWKALRPFVCVGCGTGRR